ncbi:MAG: LOG family protein [Deltaproteobacteria bacterium]|nr:LOG family protein [Deltaproteobacteria bacterium]
MVKVNHSRSQRHRISSSELPRTQPAASKTAVAKSTSAKDARQVDGQDSEALARHLKLTGASERAPSSARRVDRPGARARIDLRDWQPGQLKQTFRDDIARSFELLKRLPPAVTFFGGARIKPDDPYYALAQEIGRQLATAGIPPRTGGGPGIMTAVPEGYKAGPSTPLPDAIAFHPLVAGFSEQASADDHRTQAFNILLPHEQKLNNVIDVAEEIALFPYRKCALYENVRGLVTFPGGFGTLDELFEVWSRGARGRHRDPMAVVGSEFWRPLLGAVEQVAVEQRGLVSRDHWALMKVADRPQQILQHLADAEGVRGFETDPDLAAEQMTREIGQAIEVLDRLPPAVTFIGGRRLSPSAEECRVAADAARLLTEAGVATRVGGISAVAGAVVSGARAADAGVEVQGFVVKREDGDRQLAGVHVHLAVDELITHKELIGRRSRALVALPGGLGTLSELFSVLCQVQTGMLEKVPIVLVGKSYWQPIFDAIRQQLLEGPRQTIAAKDLDLVTITDDPQVIARVVADAGGRST